MDEFELEVLQERSKKLAALEKDLRAFFRYVDEDFPLFRETFDRHVKRLRRRVEKG